MTKAVRSLAPEQAHYLAEMAERARAGLSRFVGYEVDYNATALQLLDEWIDRHLRQLPNPSPGMCSLWIGFLGEMFRRHHRGEWVFQEQDKGKGLAVLCPTESGGLYTVDVSGQISRRIAHGISASLVYFYTVTCIELKAK
ncbi:MAG: hypothetical protein SWK90_12575 [Chloroflexota bacterium]|nr:hypothetical protein [Chloroflexota bacterium]